MKSIENGHLTPGYQDITEPYRQVLGSQTGKFNEGNPNSHTNLEILLAHDFRNFALDMSRSAIKDTQASLLINQGDIRTMQQDLLESLVNIDLDKVKHNKPTGEDQQARYERSALMVEHMPLYVGTLFDSMRYLRALSRSDLEAEEQSLADLSGRKVPLLPISMYYQADLVVDGQREGSDSCIDGLRFIAFYNLLTNAKYHSIGLDQDSHYATVELDSSRGKIVVKNISHSPMTQDRRGKSSFYYHQHGLFIANLYADLAGVELSINCEENGTYDRVLAYKSTGNVTEPQEKYSVIATMI